MAQKIIMPKQGLQMTTGIINKWLVKEGDFIKEGDPMFEMETDKLSITIDSSATGTVLKLLYNEGDDVDVAETIAIVGTPGEDYSALLAGGESAEAPAEETAAAPAAEAQGALPADVYPVIMPKQGLQMEVGTITKWLVKEGDSVKEGDPMFEMETDKLGITID